MDFPGTVGENSQEYVCLVRPYVRVHVSNARQIITSPTAWSLQTGGLCTCEFLDFIPAVNLERHSHVYGPRSGISCKARGFFPCIQNKIDNVLNSVFKLCFHYVPQFTAWTAITKIMFLIKTQSVLGQRTEQEQSVVLLRRQGIALQPFPAAGAAEGKVCCLNPTADWITICCRHQSM